MRTMVAFSIPGQSWLVSERDSCGVGFIADRLARPTHRILSLALKALECVEHRGGCSADRDSGDGAGVLTAIPWQILSKDVSGIDPDRCCVGMFFLPQDPQKQAICREITTKVAQEEGLNLLGWRVVPCNPDVLGGQARENLPQIEQAVFRKGENDRAVYITRRRIKLEIEQLYPQWHEEFYIASLAPRTIVYKGMVRSVVLSQFYLDLQNPDFITTFAVYHRRFSTNTMPKWHLAQPMRLLGHNGEINTLLGNINWFKAREKDLAHPAWGARLQDLCPILKENESDSANLDHVFELLVETGRNPLEALMILVPEAYRNQPDLADKPEIVDFYDFYSGIQEPWDGPALLAFSDGKTVGAILDRNGLRPARYMITTDDLLIVSSEAGSVVFPEEQIIEKGRLGPGQTIAVDLAQKQILKNWEIKQTIACAHPYGEWLKQHRHQLSSHCFNIHNSLDEHRLLAYQAAFGYTFEDVDMVIETMAETGKEPVFCMGDDTPLAVLSQRPRLIYDYFKQRFAQVTNPPIDPLREGMVMSLEVHLGRKGNLLAPEPICARLVHLNSPVLHEGELEALYETDRSVQSLHILFPVQSGVKALEQTIVTLCDRAVELVKNGCEILVLSDRGLDANWAFIPPLLAVGAVHHRLIWAGLRMQVSLVVETAQCWSTHHFACLIGYGASAICPYLALETVRQWWSRPKTQMSQGKIKQLTIEQVQASYRRAVEAGLLKILSKMGISLLASYHGAQIFEAIGIGKNVIDRCLRGTVSRIGGMEFADLAQEVLNFHQQAFPELQLKKLANIGYVQYRPAGEYHMNSPEMVKALHKAVAGKEYDHYEIYRQHLETRTPTALRDLLEFKTDRLPLPLEQVESVETIVQRFCTGAMSLGALSREAHEVLAIAMNRLGGKSNCGEGGEDPIRAQKLSNVDPETGLSPTFPHLKGLRNGDTPNSAIKQIASGRFGVTPAYLVSSDQLEIKIAQGAKPGEGGQLPGSKVSDYIAMLRNSKPGVPLISPPPHHDIYSIEDLAQLIYDLHQINPQAKVSVKLVAEIGIGTIGAGVAKANADIIQISGHDGGTGASPLSSIKHAGTSWELGLSEVHQVLLQNKLRDRVLLRVDGGFKTGWDVVMAALLGGEEYGFGTAAMIAEGCIMARVCHTNKCPVGVTSQLEQYRKRFPGSPDHVVNFLLFVAEEVRHLLARLGYHSLSDIIGRSDLLITRPNLSLTKLDAKQINLDCLLRLPEVKTDRSWLNHAADAHSNGKVLEDEILARPEVQRAIADQHDLALSLTIMNTDRSVGARIAGVIAKHHQDAGLASQLNLKFEGAAGQSFGAFNLPGMHLHLIGEANDYVGKGMRGGTISITPALGYGYDPAQNSIVGNTCLYGATGGYLFAYGRAGERFGVRNSGSKAVIEGTGDHCCEYMTGGVIVVLGTTGRNVGAGMTGGIAYFLDEDGHFSDRLSQENLTVQRLQSKIGIVQLQELLQMSLRATGSQKVKNILDRWDHFLPLFWQVVPPSELNSPEVVDEKVPDRGLKELR